MAVWRARFLLALVALSSFVSFSSAQTPDEIFHPTYKGLSDFTGCAAEPLVDGRPYLESLADALTQAKREIIIVGWKIHPEIRLTGRNTPLEKTLIQYISEATARGVKVYVIFWNNLALYAFGRDWMGMRVPEGLKAFRAAGAVALEDRGYGYLPTLRWSQHQKTIIIDRTTAFVGGLDIAMGRYDTHKHILNDQNRYEYSDDDNSFSKMKAYKPWHDIQVRINGYAAASTAANAVQRWQQYCGQTWVFGAPDGCKNGQVPPSNPSYFAEFHTEFESVKATTAAEFKLTDAMVGLRGGLAKVLASRNEQTVANFFAKTEAEYMDQCQTVRSISDWSAGLPTETSIMNSQMDMIRQAKRYIYIEQQYFSSQPFADNPLANILLERVKTAILAMERFKVIILLPLACEESHAVYPTQKTILLDPKALWPRLLSFIKSLATDANFPAEVRAFATTIDPTDYLSFYYMGTYQADNDAGATALSFRQVFIHAKIMIIDDRVATIGSANFNDRSFLGDRDSEFGVVIRPAKTVSGVMAGQPFVKGEFAKKFRMGLWEEHLGSSNMDAWEDLVSVEVFDKIWRATARRNSDIVNQLFGISLPALDINNDFLKAEEGIWTLPNASQEQVALFKQLQGDLFVYEPNVWGDDESKLKSIVDSLPWLGPALKGTLPGDIPVHAIDAGAADAKLNLG
eukprot:GILJ01001345.1.p1 GENE.GILJ01001345.1~~GILJ01001345.1.p1  ORF type:complete len:699 (+),score=124.87 GILJ01001345.1:44-2098(+)